VYKGKLRATGEDVAVKVQRPFVLETVSLDLYLLRNLGLQLRKASEEAARVDMDGHGTIRHVTSCAARLPGFTRPWLTCQSPAVFPHPNNQQQIPFLKDRTDIVALLDEFAKNFYAGANKK